MKFYHQWNKISIDVRWAWISLLVWKTVLPGLMNWLLYKSTIDFMLKCSYFWITRTWTKVIICFNSHDSRIDEAIDFHTRKSRAHQYSGNNFEGKTNIGTDAGKHFHRLHSHHIAHSPLSGWQEHNLSVKTSLGSAALGLFTEQLWHDGRFEDQVGHYCISHQLLDPDTKLLFNSLLCLDSHFFSQVFLWGIFFPSVTTSGTQPASYSSTQIKCFVLGLEQKLLCEQTLVLHSWQL